MTDAHRLSETWFVCVVCGKPFEREGRAGRFPLYCSIECRREMIKARNYPKSRHPSSRPCDEAVCDRPHYGRGLCKMHLKRVRRSEGRRSPSDDWSERRRNNYQQRRRASRSQTGVTPVLLAWIVARDGTDCRWCEKPIDMDLRWPDRMSRSFDHIVPLSRGGLHVIENVQLMHLSCNASKSNWIPDADNAGS